MNEAAVNEIDRGGLAAFPIMDACRESPRDFVRHQDKVRNRDLKREQLAAKVKDSNRRYELKQKQEAFRRQQVERDQEIKRGYLHAQAENGAELIRIIADAIRTQGRQWKRHPARHLEALRWPEPKRETGGATTRKSVAA